MNKLHWRAANTAELALLLKQAKVQDSRAIGSATVYQLTHDGRDLLAVSLADGQALVIESVAKPRRNRRQPILLPGQV